MRFTASALFGLALLLFGDTSRAQTASSTDTPALTNEETIRADAWSQFLFEEVLLRSCDDPTLRSAIALPQPKVILEATDDGKTKVTARVGVKIKKTFVFNVEATSPRSSSGETTLASLDGLSDGSTAELKLSWFGWRSPEKGIQRMVKGWDDPEPGNEVGKRSPYEAMKTIVSSPTNTKWKIEDYLKSTLSRPSALAMLGSEEYKRIAEIYQDWLKEKHPLIPVLNVKVNAEQKEFKFFIPTDGPPAGLKRASESHTNYQLTASVGTYFRGRTYASANYLRGTKYTNGASQEFCTPTGAARILDCTSPVVAPPKKGTPEALEFEARSLFGSFGVGAHLTRDLQANVTVIEIPVYLLQKLGTSEMELNLGARLQWRSDTKDYGISVFIGPALSTVLRMFNG